MIPVERWFGLHGNSLKTRRGGCVPLREDSYGKKHEEVTFRCDDLILFDYLEI